MVFFTFFCIQSFTQMCISSSTKFWNVCKSDDSGKVRLILSKLQLQFFFYYYTLLYFISYKCTTTCVIIDRRWSWNMIKFNFTGSACQTNPCGKNALCQDSPDGAYRCTCQEGYTGDPFRGCIGMLNDWPLSPLLISYSSSCSTFTDCVKKLTST